MEDFENLRNTYKSLKAIELKQAANNAIGISLSLSDKDRRDAIADWFTQYDKLRKMGKNDRGTADEFLSAKNLNPKKGQ